MTAQGAMAGKDVILTFRVSPSEAREFRLVAKAQGVTTSEAIRRAMRQRAEVLAKSDTRARN